MVCKYTIGIISYMEQLIYIYKRSTRPYVTMNFKPFKNQGI